MNRNDFFIQEAARIIRDRPDELLVFAVGYPAKQNGKRRFCFCAEE